MVAQILRVEISEPESNPVKSISVFENCIQQPDTVSVRQRERL